jgi:hypothetical protein
MELDEMVEKFELQINKALDEVAPFKSFTVKSQYKFGISDVTKLMLQKRDQTRSMIKMAAGNQKQEWYIKYKKMRNMVNNSIRKEYGGFNNKIIDEAKDENKF